MDLTQSFWEDQSPEFSSTYNKFFPGFSGRRKRSTKEEEEESDEAKRLLLKILELISMDPSQHLNVGKNPSDKSESTIGPCLLYRLCEVPTKLLRDRDEIQLLDLVQQYRYYQPITPHGNNILYQKRILIFLCHRCVGKLKES